MAGTAELSNGNTAIFLLQGREVRLFLLAGKSVSAAAINDAGVIVGSSYDAYNHWTLPVLFRPDGTSNRSYGLDQGGGKKINQQGLVLGSAYNKYSNYTYFWTYNSLSPDTRATRLNFFDYYGYASDMNEAGSIVGRFNGRPMIYREGQPHPLGTGFDNEGIAYAINNHDEIVGEFTAASGETHGFYFSNGVLTDLHEETGEDFRPHAISDSGAMLGTIVDGTDRIPALYDDGVLIDLNNLASNSFGWKLSSANVINESGQIVGFGYDPEGRGRACLLTPVDPNQPTPSPAPPPTPVPETVPTPTPVPTPTATPIPSPTPLPTTTPSPTPIPTATPTATSPPRPRSTAFPNL